MLNFPQIISLNVGGLNYCTTLETLTKGENMLASMFSGRMGVLKDATGAYFIDRDGQLFSHILNFLRTNSVVVESLYMAKRLLPEAEFYAIEDLISYLKEEIKSFEEHEVSLRNGKTDRNEPQGSENRRRQKTRSITLESSYSTYSQDSFPENDNQYELVEDANSSNDSTEEEHIPVEFDQELFTNEDF